VKFNSNPTVCWKDQHLQSSYLRGGTFIWRSKASIVQSNTKV